MAQFRLVDVAKRQLKTPPDARDVSWSIRKREILAKHKVRFATLPLDQTKGRWHTTISNENT